MNISWHLKKLVQHYRFRKITIGKNSRINIGTIINRPENMSIGDNTYINGGIFTIGKNSHITIGNDCLISYNVHLRCVTHNYEDKHTLIREQGEYEQNIIIEDDVWVGYGAQIMHGVTLHKGCVVGAGAVVTHDVMPYNVVAGVPARVIKYRI